MRRRARAAAAREAVQAPAVVKAPKPVVEEKVAPKRVIETKPATVKRLLKK